MVEVVVVVAAEAVVEVAVEVVALEQAPWSVAIG